MKDFSIQPDEKKFSITGETRTFAITSVIFEMPFDWDRYWEELDKLTFWGKYSQIAEGKMPNILDDGASYLTVTGSAGAENYQCPNTSVYKNADTDYIWFNPNTTQRTVSTNELIDYDLQRTPVAYDSVSPYAITEIFILKAGETLTVGELDKLHEYLQLSILWSGVINDYGILKTDRMSQRLYVPVGTELIDQSNWYKTAYWTLVHDANWSQVGVTHASNGVSGNCVRGGMFVVGHNYMIRIRGSVTSGTYKIHANAAPSPPQMEVDGKLYIYYNIMNSTNVYLTSYLFLGAITELSIKEVL